MPEIRNDILAALAYFDIFNYPLTGHELFLFLGNAHESDAFNNAIKNLVTNHSIYQLEEFYSLQDNLHLADRRRKGNAAAKKLIKTAEKVASILSHFPYVRGIAISGSLSKNFADEDSDIDLFIITARNRLWLARTFMHIFKKLTFLVNKQHLFCMNYYIDEDGLEIVEKNIYTAIEIATLIPLRGDATFDRFYNANAWVRPYLPNHSIQQPCNEKLRNGWFKTFIESCFNNMAGHALNHYLMKITATRWLRKTQKMKLNSRGITMSMDASEHYAKPHPADFQTQFIARYENKVNETIRHCVAVAS